MGVEQFVNVSYQGIDVGQSLKLVEFGPQTAYLEVVSPMPVGTELRIETDGGLSFAARVVRVQEQVAGAEHPPGMRIRVGDLDDAVSAWWKPLVETGDPEVPEPAVVGAPVAEPAEAEAPPVEAAEEPAADAVPEPIEEADVTVPNPKEARRTTVMNADEIRAAIEAGGDNIDELMGDSGSNGESKKPESKKSESKKSDASSDDNTDDGKNGKKKRRRRRKSRKG